MKTRKVLFAVFMVLILASSACTLDAGGGKVFSFGATPTPLPTNTPLPPTATPRPTATPKPTATPRPTATPTPVVVLGIDAPIDVMGVGLRFYAVERYEKVLLNDKTVYPTNAGNEFIIVQAMALYGGPMIGMWPAGAGPDSVHIIDQNGKSWWWVMKYTPKLEADNARWTFEVPKGTEVVSIVLFEGIEVDLTPLQ